MSTILKALRRLEDEAQAQARAEAPADPLAPPPQIRRSLVGRLAVAVFTAAGAAIAGAAAMLGFLWLRAPATSDSAPAIAAPPALASPAAREPAAALDAPPIAPAPVAPAPAPAPVASPGPSEPEVLGVADAREDLAPAPAQEPQASEWQADEGMPSDTPTDDARIDVTRHADEAAQVVELTRRTDWLRVERTIWHPSPEKRRAIVRVGDSRETIEVLEGDRVEGWRVESIEPGEISLRDPLGGPTLRKRVGE
jgi:hypothetical protein